MQKKIMITVLSMMIASSSTTNPDNGVDRCTNFFDRMFSNFDSPANSMSDSNSQEEYMNGPELDKYMNDPEFINFLNSVDNIKPFGNSSAEEELDSASNNQSDLPGLLPKQQSQKPPRDSKKRTTDSLLKFLLTNDKDSRPLASNIRGPKDQNPSQMTVKRSRDNNQPKKRKYDSIPENPILNNPNVASSSNSIGNITVRVDNGGTKADRSSSGNSSKLSRNSLPNEKASEGKILRCGDSITQPTTMIKSLRRYLSNQNYLLNSLFPNKKNITTEGCAKISAEWLIDISRYEYHVIPKPNSRYNLTNNIRDGWNCFKRLFKPEVEIDDITKSRNMPFMILLYVNALNYNWNDDEANSLLLLVRSMCKNRDGIKETSTDNKKVTTETITGTTTETTTSTTKTTTENKEISLSVNDLHKAKEYLNSMNNTNTKDDKNIPFIKTLHHLISMLGSEKYTNILKDIIDKNLNSWVNPIIFNTRLEFFTSEYFKVSYTDILTKFYNLGDDHKSFLNMANDALLKSFSGILELASAWEEKRNGAKHMNTPESSSEPKHPGLRMLDISIEISTAEYDRLARTNFENLLKGWCGNEINNSMANLILEKYSVELKYMIASVTVSVSKTIETLLSLFGVIYIHKILCNIRQATLVGVLSHVFAPLISYYFDPESIRELLEIMFDPDKKRILAAAINRDRASALRWLDKSKKKSKFSAQ